MADAQTATPPTDIYEPAGLDVAAINAAIIAFDKAKGENPELELMDSMFGSVSMAWYVIDYSTYDGEPVSTSPTPIDALLDWHAGIQETEVAA